jgi:hypothetical protein
MRKNPSTTLAGSGLPRNSTALPERDANGQIIDYEERAADLPLVTAPPTSPEFRKQLKAIFQQLVERCGVSKRSADEQYKNIVAALGLKRGRLPKNDKAQTTAERVREHRARKKLAAEQQQIDEAFAQILATYPTWDVDSRRAARKAFMTTEGRQQIAALSTTIARQIVETLGTSVYHGRQRFESVKSNIEDIFAAKSRGGGVDEDSYADTDRRRVIPEGHDKDADADLRWEEGENSPKKHPASTRQKWGTDQERKERAQIQQEFLEESFEVIVVENDKTENGTENEDEDEGIQLQLRCKLPIDDYHRKLYGVRRDTPCSFRTDLMEGMESDDPPEDLTKVSAELWDEAQNHIDAFHGKESRRFQRANLAAWIKSHDGLPGSAHGGKFMKPINAVERQARQAERERRCLVDHERTRQEQIVQKSEDALHCHCGRLIYDPAKDLL